MKAILFNLGIVGMLLLSQQMLAQDELKQAVEGATTQITNARAGAIRLGQAAAAIVGIVGAIAVYSKWSNGESDVRKASASWLGGLLFIAIAFMILESI
ncbi:DUF4134 family protein [Fibrivirga algicola]|uniref:DUF4134 domain-containing protein n=1 Tax=Fibrivirga algicola TaxID=2950420 RepID=A0ABX0QMR3_9BACT|nr:DUF4134 family protein [Fibrivirga algicola]NID13411.1 DUF4134 domain-containing protein [Fibrivirga algicola]